MMRRCVFVLTIALTTAYFSACGGSKAPAGLSSPAARLSAYVLSYGSSAIGGSSATQTVTLTNNGSASLAISGITTSSNFAQTNTCGGTVVVGGTCTITVTFTPTAAGDLSGAVTITDNALGGPQVISLSGTGILSGVTLGGVVTKSGVNNATVTVFAVNADGTNGAVLGTGTTDANGVFSITLATKPTGPVRIIVTGGTYVSEADGTTVTSSSAVTALLDDASTSSSDTSITAVSTFVDSLTTGLIGAGATTVTDAHGVATTTINGFYGFPAGTKLEKLLAKFTKADSTSDPNGFLLGLIVGALAQEGKILDTSDPDALIAALAADIFDGKWDGKKEGTPVHLGGGSLPSTAGTSDFLSDLATYVEDGTTPTDNGITTSDVSSLENSVGTSVSTCTCTPTAVGLAATSSGAINSLAFGGKQYLFVAARNKGVVVIDITDPTLTSPPVYSWPQISSNASGSGGLDGLGVGGIIPFVGTAGHPQVFVFSYGSKHALILNAQTLVSGVPGTNNPVDAEMNLPIAATSAVGFSGGSAFIGSGVPLGGSLLFLATADGYDVIDANLMTAGTNPVIKNYPVGDPSGIIAENMGADITHNLMVAGYYGGIQLLDLSAGPTNGVSYYVTSTNFYTVFPLAQSSEIDGNSADSAYQVGIFTDEDTNYVDLVNLSNITKTVSTTTGVLNSWAPATGGAAHVMFGTSGPTISGSAVDSTTHLALFMAGYSNDIAVGKLQDPNSVPSGSTWAGMSDWSFTTINNSSSLSQYQDAQDPHADGVVFNLLKNTTYGYVLDGATSPTGVVQIDLAGFLAVPRAGTTGDPAFQPGADPTTVTNSTTGGKVMQEFTLP